MTQDDILRKYRKTLIAFDYDLKIGDLEFEQTGIAMMFSSLGLLILGCIVVAVTAFINEYWGSMAWGVFVGGVLFLAVFIPAINYLLSFDRKIKVLRKERDKALDTSE